MNRKSFILEFQRFIIGKKITSRNPLHFQSHRRRSGNHYRSSQLKFQRTNKHTETEREREIPSARKDLRCQAASPVSLYLGGAFIHADTREKWVGRPTGRYEWDETTPALFSETTIRPGTDASFSRSSSGL